MAIKALKAKSKKRELVQMLGRTTRNNVGVYLSGNFGRSFSNIRSSSATSTMSKGRNKTKKHHKRADSVTNSYKL